jgi:hypothetical protein
MVEMLVESATWESRSGNGRFWAVIVGPAAPGTRPESVHHSKNFSMLRTWTRANSRLSLLMSFRDWASTPIQEFIRADHPATRFEHSERNKETQARVHNGLTAS